MSAEILALRSELREARERIAALEAALVPLAAQDCESWGCVVIGNPNHGCAPQRAVALLHGKPAGEDRGDR